MKTRSTLLFFAVAALAAAPLLRADQPDNAPPPPPHDRPDLAQMREHRLERLDRKLKLTDAQKTQINAIWDKSEADGRAVRQDKSLSREARRDKMRDLMKTTHDQVRSVLTADQQKTFDTLRPMRPMHDGDRPPASQDETKT